MDSFSSAASHPLIPRQGGEPLRVEPTIALEWADAIELVGVDPKARSPRETRRAWVHRADEATVLRTYLAVRAVDPAPEGPWWLEAITSGALTSRDQAFALEDRVDRLLSARSGWAFSPWSSLGDMGYWEFLPSETRRLHPTALVFTARHSGWIDVIAAHDGEPEQRVAVRGTLGLRSDLGAIERWG